MSPSVEAYLMYVRKIREGLEGLEALLQLEAEEQGDDPYARRQQVLEQLYVREGLEKPALMHVLRDAGTTYQWIGQQVKKGYLAVSPLPTGKTRYTVTPKAVRELELGKHAIAEEAVAYTAMSEEAFAEDWNSPEDAIYDKL